MRKIYLNYQLKKWFLSLVISLLCLSSVPYLTIFGNSAQATQISQINVENLKNLIDSQSDNFTIIDVRTPKEYQTARIADAINIPLIDLQKGIGINQIQLLAKDQKIILYCSAGIRSSKAINLLNQANVSGMNLQGGIREWRLKIEPTMPAS
jgi:sulfur-carrier protein adenylyltransferase/sulfurtransferase